MFNIRLPCLYDLVVISRGKMEHKREHKSANILMSILYFRDLKYSVNTFQFFLLCFCNEPNTRPPKAFPVPAHRKNRDSDACSSRTC